MKNLSRSAFGILIFTMVFGAQAYDYTQEQCNNLKECKDVDELTQNWTFEVAGNRVVCRVNDDSGKCTVKYYTMCLSDAKNGKYSWVGDASPPQIACMFYKKRPNRMELKNATKIDLKLDKRLTEAEYSRMCEEYAKKLNTDAQLTKTSEEIFFSQGQFLLLSQGCSTTRDSFFDMLIKFQEARFKNKYDWPGPFFGEVKTPGASPDKVNSNFSEERGFDFTGGALEDINAQERTTY